MTETRPDPFTAAPAGAPPAVEPPPATELAALRLPVDVDVPLEPAPARREWMDATPERFANRCLPMLLANQAGWVLGNPDPFTAVWDGGDAPENTLVFGLDGAPPAMVTSHFGSGVVTWTIPYLFRTEPGWNLLVRGPANWPKDGITALEGLVETDWAVATFTMNWKLTRPDQPVVFRRGEPFCMVVPQRRGELEAVRPVVRPVDGEPGGGAEYRHWADDRSRFLRELAAGRHAGPGWQRDYFRGTTPAGEPAPVHQNRLRLAPFAEPDAPA